MGDKSKGQSAVVKSASIPARPRVVIVGGGFGGLLCAQGLADADVDVTVVDRTNHHLFQPLLYQVAMAGLSPAEIAAPIRGVLSAQENTRVLLAEVSGVDLDGRRVRLEGGDALEYDWLVLAVGAKTSYFGHEEWEAHAPGLKTIDDALEIRRRVLVAFERAEMTTDDAERERLLTFVVIGGGPTGVELAGAIAELAHNVLDHDFRTIDPEKARVVLVEAGPRILAAFPEELSESAKEQLAELGVEVETGRVTTIDEGGVELDGTRRVAARTVLWGAGVRGTRLAETLGVPLDKMGRVIVERDASIPGHPEAFAIGDMAHLEEAPGKPLPGLCPVAMQQGRYVAEVIARAKAKGDREPFAYVDKGTMATIGRSRAIAMTGRMRLRGFLAWLAWLFVHLLFLIGFRNRFVVLFTWAWSYFSYKRGARLITERGGGESFTRSSGVPSLRRPEPAARGGVERASTPDPVAVS